MNLREHAGASLYLYRLVTNTYAFDVSGLHPNKKLVARVKRRFKERVAERVDDDQYLDLIRSGDFQRYEAATHLGMDPVLIRRRLKVDAEFAERVTVAEAMAMEAIVKVVRNEALHGDMKAAFKLLESKSAEEFGAPEQRIQVRVEGTITSDASPVLARILELEQDLQKQAALRGLNVMDAEVVEDKELE